MSETFLNINVIIRKSFVHLHTYRREVQIRLLSLWFIILMVGTILKRYGTSRMAMALEGYILGERTGIEVDSKNAKLNAYHWESIFDITFPVITSIVNAIYLNKEY